MKSIQFFQKVFIADILFRNNTKFIQILFQQNIMSFFELYDIKLGQKSLTKIITELYYFLIRQPPNSWLVIVKDTNWPYIIKKMTCNVACVFFFVAIWILIARRREALNWSLPSCDSFYWWSPLSTVSWRWHPLIVFCFEIGWMKQNENIAFCFWRGYNHFWHNLIIIGRFNEPDCKEE